MLGTHGVRVDNHWHSDILWIPIELNYECIGVIRAANCYALLYFTTPQMYLNSELIFSVFLLIFFLANKFCSMFIFKH